MIQTLKITDIVTKWRDALRSSQDISDFCNSHYGKLPQIRVGLNRKSPPTQSDCPLIILRPGAKVEGEAQEDFRYVVSVGWSIYNAEQTETDGVIELQGIYECDSLGQLIFEVLSGVNPSYPITTVDYELEVVEFFPQFVGDMELEVSITPAIGGSLVY